MALTRACAHELGPHGITVNCLCPGYVLDAMDFPGSDDLTGDALNVSGGMSLH